MSIFNINKKIISYITKFSLVGIAKKLNTNMIKSHKRILLIGDKITRQYTELWINIELISINT